MIEERDLKKTARSLQEAASGASDATLRQDREKSQEALSCLIESRLVSAAWVLRRMPDRERGFLRMRGALWPEMAMDASTYPRPSMSSFESRYKARMSAAEIDAMQPMLDLLLLLPDPADRQIIFWAAWHQDGEKQARIPWVKVRRALGGNLSRWTLKRRYEAGLMWLAALVALQV